jgi:hypothetical protein
MASTERVGSLEINQDLGFLAKAWKVQRIGWVIMVLLLLAGLAGLLGSGPLSRATAGADGDPVQVQYERFARYRTPTELHFRLSSAALRDGEYSVWLSRDLLQQLQVEAVSPPPERVETGTAQLRYIFAAANPTGPTGITFFVKPEHIGRLSGQVGPPDGLPLNLDMFIYP